MNANDLLSLFNSMAEEEQIAFLERVAAQEAVKASTQPSASAGDTEPSNVRRACPRCGQPAKANGTTRSGRQRYYCRNCGKSFSDTTGTILQHTLKDSAIWSRFIDCVMECRTIRDSAHVCGISVATAFNWRHKVLDSMQEIMESVRMDGVIECDETFFRLSFKGDHKKSRDFTMPREVHRRGNDNHVRGISQEQVCVSTAVTKGGLSIGRIANTGPFKEEAVSLIYGGKISSGSTVCTDSHKAYGHLAESLHVKHVKVDPDKHMKGKYGIQCINSYHSRLKGMIARFHGVATKYLNNYIVWNNFVNHAKLPKCEKKRILLEHIAKSLCQTRGYSLSKREPVPTVI